MKLNERGYPVYTYVSTRADYDPVKTIFVCAPSGEAKTVEAAGRFASASGWKDLAEYDGAVLIVPVVPLGWDAEDHSLPGNIFDALRNTFSSRNGRSLFGRDGKLWCWETMVYLVGYGDGADFAGGCLVANPGRFAAAALVGGAPRGYANGRDPSGHWMVRNVSADYRRRNDQIPSCLWLLGAEEEQASAALAYFSGVNGLSEVPEERMVGTISALCYQNPDEPAQQVLVSRGTFPPAPELAQTILSHFFDRVIRWKDGPDGTLCLHLTRAEFYTGSRFIQDSVRVDTLDYPLAIHLPEGMTREEAKGLPVVFSVHGRGEPAWLFASKNGWDVLADETRAFVLAVPDSPGNIWQLERDKAAFPAMIDKLCTEYGLDRSRVYLTGFSNGGSITREAGTACPQLFAGICPSNAPVGVPGLLAPDVIAPDFELSGIELPYWVYVGDSDPAAGVDVDGQLEIMLRANGCALRPAQGLTTRFAPDEVRTGENYYTERRGYRQGGRFYTLIYRDAAGVPKVGYTVMKSMPHGAIGEQSRAAWEFLRHFSREADGTLHYEKEI
ncbi:MAG: hypothetical protein K2N78_08210 [Oscillospiraceae bacterium]|nr:hypothetical protein [Oscillospiraceae bacterium]